MDFGHATEADVHYAYGNDVCGDFSDKFNDKVKSVKYAGQHDDWRVDSITMFAKHNYQSTELYTREDIPLVTPGDGFPIQSAIINGETSWALYE